MKKLIALVLTLAIMVTCMPIVTFATDLEHLMPEIVYRDNDDYLFVNGKRVELQGKIFDYRHPQKNYVNTYVPAKFFIELAGGKLTEWEHSSKVAKFEISGNKLEIDCKNGTYKINNAPKEDLMFEIIIEDGVLYLSQTDLFVKMFDTLWGNFMYNNTGYMHIHEYDYPWEDVYHEQEHSLIDSLYNSVNEEYEDEIATGTVYVSDGTHLYNRVSDPQSVLGYTDNYVYTLATPYDELYIPDGKVFTAKGNYLYDKETKEYAKVSVLKACDARINEIKTYVEKSILKAYSNNEITEAYKNMLISNEVNTVIDEYLNVKRAKKDFNEVSEQKITYVLKTGSKGENVSKIQQELYELGFSNQLVTGEYGSITASNVAYFQVINGLDVTGWVNNETYNKILGTQETIAEPKDTTPYAYPTNLQEGMEVTKGSYSFNVVGNENCDGIRLTMYSTTLFNDGLSQWYNYDGNDVNGYFDCTDVGSYTLMVESRNDSTGETFQYGMNFEVVDTTTGGDLYAYYMLGVWDGVVGVSKGLWTNVTHPIDTIKSTASGMLFLTKALTPWGGEERQAIFDLWTNTSYEVLNNVATKEAKETARAFGKFTAEVLIAIGAEKGASKAVSAIKESAESGKLGKVGTACIKAQDKADDFITELMASSKIINQFDDVVAYLKKHGKLPDNYVTKDVAIKAGWKQKKGNLADVLPGKSIGGDVYKNIEGKLPSKIGRIWYEADINYTSGYRGKERLYYSNDGLFYKTINHAETMIRIGE